MSDILTLLFLFITVAFGFTPPVASLPFEWALRRSSGQSCRDKQTVRYTFPNVFYSRRRRAANTAIWQRQTRSYFQVLLSTLARYGMVVGLVEICTRSARRARPLARQYHTRLENLENRVQGVPTSPSHHLSGHLHLVWRET